MGSPQETEWITAWGVGKIAHCIWIYDEIFSAGEHPTCGNEAEFFLLSTLSLTHLRPNPNAVLINADHNEMMEAIVPKGWMVFLQKVEMSLDF